MPDIQNIQYLHGLWALLIPVIIHLWNQKKAKVRKVGSVDWLIPVENSRVNQIQFHELFRFLIRVGLILSLVLFLMGLFWPLSSSQTTQAKAYLLLDPELLASGEQTLGLDSLDAQDWEIRLLQAGFPRYSPENQPLERDTNPSNHWTLLQSLDQVVDDFKEVQVWTSAQARNYRGPKPALNFPIQWKFIPAKDSSFIPLKAWESSSDSLDLWGAQSTEFYTRLERLKVLNTPGTNVAGIPGLEIQGGPPPQVKSPQASINIEEPKTLRIIMFSPTEKSLEVSYLRQALASIEEFSGLSLEIKELSDWSELEKSLQNEPAWDWLISLSSAADTYLKKDKVAQVLVLAEENRQPLIWKKYIQGQEIHFLAQLPSKSFEEGQRESLRWLEELFRLLMDDAHYQEQLAKQERRILDLDQIKTAYVAKRKKKRKVSPSNSAEKQALVWLTLFLVFLSVERWLSHRQYRKQTWEKKS